MNINQLSNITNVKNHSNDYLKKTNLNQNANVNFKKTPAVLKKALITAPLVLASLGVILPAQAQTGCTNNLQQRYINRMQNVVGPSDNMGRYFAENGFTPEQRQFIADYTENYAKECFENDTASYNEHFKNCSYYAEKNLNDSPENQLALNLDYYMNKAEKYAKSLTEFRLHMSWLNLVGEEGHYVDNPKLNPIKDNENLIQEIIGENTTYEQYVKDNAETIDKLNNLTPETAMNLTDNEKTVFSNMQQIIEIVNQYIEQKGNEYEQEAKEGLQSRILDRYENDMNNLKIFKEEKDNTKNLFMESSDDGHSIGTDFDYYGVDEGFHQAVGLVYRNILEDIATSISNTKGNNTRKGLTFDLNGRVISDYSNPGLYIRDGKKFIVK